MRNTKRTATKNQPTAAETYNARFAECQDLLERITRQLKQHRKEQQASPSSWGHFPDLVRAGDKLAYALADLGDSSAVEARGLEN